MIDELDIAAAAARIRGLAVQTPLVETAPGVWLKLETRQVTGAVKFRGAANHLLSQSWDQRARGVIASSDGNHALAVAEVCARLGAPADIFVTDAIDPDRRAAIVGRGATVATVCGDARAAEGAARARAARTGRTYVSPHGDPLVAAGQGTLGLELLDGVKDLDAVFVAVGGGGLIGGVGTVLKAFRPETEVIGCWPAASPVMPEPPRPGRTVFAADRPTGSPRAVGGLAPDPSTLDLCARVIDRTVVVNEAESFAALRALWRQHGELAQGAAGVALAAYAQVAGDYVGKSVAIVICSGNPSAALRAAIKAD